MNRYIQYKLLLETATQDFEINLPVNIKTDEEAKIYVNQLLNSKFVYVSNLKAVSAKIIESYEISSIVETDLN